MHRSGNDIKKNTLFVDKVLFPIIIVISVAVTLWPLLSTNGVLRGFDDLFHVARIVSLADSLRYGVFPVKVHSGLCHTYGYGVGFFYPNFLLYIPSVIMVLGGNFEMAYKAYAIIITLTGAMLTYIALFKVTNNRYIAVLCDIIFVESVAYYFYLYYLFSVGSYSAMMFMPSAICGVILLLRKEQIKTGAVLYSVGILGALLSHSTSFIGTMAVVGLLCIVNYKEFFKKETFGPFMLSSLFSMALSAAYWLPAIEQTLIQTFRVSLYNPYHISEGVMTFKDAVLYKVGIIVFALLIISVVINILTVLHKKSGMEAQLTILALIMFFVSICPLFWKTIGSKMDFLQFTFRLNAIITTLAVISISMSVSKLMDGSMIRDVFGMLECAPVNFKRGLFILLAIALIVSCNIYSKNVTKSNGSDYTSIIDSDVESTVHEIMGVAEAEWLPEETWYEALDQPNVSLASDNSSAEGSKHDDGKSYDVYVLLDKEFYDVPYVFYYGYRAYLLDENNQPYKELLVEKAADDNGLVRVYMPKDMEGIGHIIVTYRKTAWQIVSYVISICSVVILVLGLFISIALKKKK